MPAKSPPTVIIPHTRAWIAFEQNLVPITHMVYLGGREIRLLKAEGVRLTTSLGNPIDLASKKNFAKLERWSKTLHARVERFGTVNLWQVVMLVTCVEAYLQDLLSSAASVGPELMSDSKQVASYFDVVAATSLDELANDLRARWARGWLSEGGPTRWISRLVKMGARGYPTSLAGNLELIWGIRHAVVHTAGVATSDFVKRHPGVVKEAGVRLHTTSRDFGAFLGYARAFWEPTERFFLKRYPSLRAVDSAGPNK